MHRPSRSVASLLSLLDGLAAPQALERVARPDAALAREIDRHFDDRARAVMDLHEALSGDRGHRRSRGVFYTPARVVDAMLDRLPLHGRLVDPAAGAGAFVVALARRLGASALERIVACDIDVHALDACALALEAALGAGERARIERWRAANAHRLDFLRDPLPGEPPQLVVGNPPYGLDSSPDLGDLYPQLEGERDVYACFLLRAMEAMAEGGTTALLVPDSWLTNRGAARLRRTVAPSLGRVVDFGKPFSGARDTRVHAVVLRRGAHVCVVESERHGRLEAMDPAPVPDLQARAAAGWFLYRTTREARACRALERGGRRLGDVLEVLYGLRTGDNARHVLRADGPVRLVGGEDFDAFDRRWRPKSLVEPANKFRPNLRRQLGRWKIGVQRIRTNSKTSWRRWVECAPLTPDEAGLDSLTLVAEQPLVQAGPAPAELPDALAAALGVLNSSVLNRWYRLHFTDVNVKPLYLQELPLPPADADLAALVRRRLAAPGDGRLERAVDRLVAHAYALADDDLLVLETGWWGAELEQRPLPSLEEARRLARGA